MPEEERQQQCGNVIPVAVGIHEQDDSGVSQLMDIKAGPDSGAERVHNILDLIALQNLGQAQASVFRIFPRRGKTA